MGRAFEVRTGGMMLAAIIVAGLTSLGIMGDDTYFGTTSVQLHHLQGWAAVPVCAVCCGLVGGGFSRILIEFGRGLPGAAGRLVRRYPIAFALLCGLGAALCGIVSGNTVYGTGYGQVKALIDHGVALPQSFGFLKFVATTLASISGVPGGIFSPSLAVGGRNGANRTRTVAPLARQMHRRGDAAGAAAGLSGGNPRAGRSPGSTAIRSAARCP